MIDVGVRPLSGAVGVDVARTMADEDEAQALSANTPAKSTPITQSLASLRLDMGSVSLHALTHVGAGSCIGDLRQQQMFLHLTKRVAWQRVNEDYATGFLEAGELIATKGDDLLHAR